jgi:Protein of unknown function (DUF3572)
MVQVNRIDRKAAENLAVQALSYLAGEPEQLARFLALSGIGPDTLRAAAADPQFLAGVLDYVAGDERLLMAFAGHMQMRPEAIARARAALSGAPWERDTA